MRITTPTVMEFAYRPPLWVSIGIFLCCWPCMALFGYFAKHPSGGVVRGRIELTPEQFQTMCRIMLIVVVPIGLVMSGSLLFVSLFRDRRVALTRHSLIIPRPTRIGLSCDEIEVPFSEIAAVDLVDYTRTSKVLLIRHAGGLLHVPSVMFRSRREFDRLVQALMSAVECER